MKITSLIGHGRVALVIALLGCSSGRGPSDHASAGTAGRAGGDSLGSAGGGGGAGAGGSGGASPGVAGADGIAGAAGAGGSGGSSDVGGSAGVSAAGAGEAGASAGAGGVGASAGAGGSAGGAGGSIGAPTPCGGSTCAAGLACARGAQCFDATWANWPVSTGAAHENGDGTLTGSTGLMWEKTPPAGDGDAAAAAAACAALRTGAYADWRLPAITELLSIVDYTRSAPALGSLFSSTPDVFLSATPSMAGDGVWIVDFNSGESHVAASGRRRCVR